jgi:hypothetical protein
MSFRSPLDGNSSFVCQVYSWSQHERGVRQ